MKHQFFSQILFTNFFFIYIKLSRESSARHYEKNNEKIQEKSRERYQNITEQEENKKRQYGRERYKNLS